MKVVVTGAGGFIGSHICRLLLNEGFDVRAIIRPNGRHLNLIGIESDLEIVEADIRDSHSVKRALAGCQICYHTAALVAHGTDRPRNYFSVNTQATMTVCTEACELGIERFIYTSSCVVFGSANKGEIINETKESSLVDVLGDYGRSKFLGELEVLAAIEEGLPAVIVNPTAVTGPRDINVTPGNEFIKTYIRRKIPAYFKTGFNMVDVRDVARGHLDAFHSGKIGERYLLGGNNLMLPEMFKILKDITGINPPMIRIPYQVARTGAMLMEKVQKLFGKPISTPTPSEIVKKARYPYFFDSTKAKTELKWEPKVPPRKSIADGIQWFKEIET